MAIGSQTMTLDQFLEQYADNGLLEFRNGAVVEKMAPGWPHSAISGVLGGRVNAFAETRKLAFAFPELRLIDLVEGESRVPDLAIYAWDRIERDRMAAGVGAITPPDVVVEVASPGQSRQKQVERCREYIGSGVRIALMIDPRRQRIVDVRADGTERQLQADDRIDFEELVPGFTLLVSELFAAIRFE